MMNKLIFRRFFGCFNGTHAHIFSSRDEARELFKVHHETLQYSEDDHRSQSLLSQQKCRNC